MNQARTWTKNYHDLGVARLQHSAPNKDWTPKTRFELVVKVLAGNSISSVAKTLYVNAAQVYQWVRKYKEKGMDGLQCKKGGPAKQSVMKKKIKKSKFSISKQEELKLLRERNEYFKKRCFGLF